MFRGWMLSGIARKLNVPIAVLLTSLLFGLLHHSPNNPMAFVGTFMFSVFTCCWVLRVGHVWGVMGWHAGWNWLLCTGFELPLSGTNPIAPALITQAERSRPEAAHRRRLRAGGERGDPRRVGGGERAAGGVAARVEPSGRGDARLSSVGDRSDDLQAASPAGVILCSLIACIVSFLRSARVLVLLDMAFCCDMLLR